MPDAVPGDPRGTAGHPGHMSTAPATPAVARVSREQEVVPVLQVLTFTYVRITRLAGQVRRVRVHGHPEGDVVLERRLQRAEQEGEAGRGVERPAHPGPVVAGEPGLGDAQVGRVA